MKIHFLGACREVGRSGFAVEIDGKYIVLDYGVLMDHEVGFPAHLPPKDVDSIILSHAHLDHSGLLPIFYLRDKTPLYGVEPSFQLSNLLIKDFLNISGYLLPFEYIDLESMMGCCINIPYGQRFNRLGAEITLLNAGHIPGSCQTLIEADSKRILYTGDFNTTPTRLLGPADPRYDDLDCLIVESTYATEEHPDRGMMEEEFVSQATEVVKEGGVVLVPAFGVGRSQEIISILAARGFKYPVYVDGMALKTIHILENFGSSLRDPEFFKRAVRNAEWIDNWKERRKAASTPSVIVSPAGMLKGGSAIFYLERIARDKKNAIFLVSFQIPGTPGSILLEKKKFIIKGRSRKVDAKVMKFDFSSHVGKNELHDVLKKLDSRTKVFVVHGAEENCRSLANYAQKELGLEAIAPEAGEAIQI
ncbi:MAG: MBL fold metallo-hydrolase [Candidatus Bathyarchaeia archaeon]